MVRIRLVPTAPTYPPGLGTESSKHVANGLLEATFLSCLRVTIFECNLSRLENATPSLIFDRIDRDIVRAIGERRQYVIAAAAFKTTPTGVAAPERFTAMLQMRRRWAEEEGLNPNVIEKLYRDLVSHFIAEEQAHWSSQQNVGIVERIK